MNKSLDSLTQSLVLLLNDEQAASDQIKRLETEYARTCLARAFVGAEPKALVAKFVQTCSTNSGPCRRIIDQSTPFVYRCLDCRVAPNTLICIDCFKLSSHFGHRIFRQVITGVCDCGDDQSWKKEGNCSKHTGN